MQRRVVVNNGKRYVVNVVGWEDGVGSGGPPGQVWMQSTDGNWYAVSATGTGGTAAISINQTPTGWIDPGGQAFSYQLLKSTDGNVYKISLSGNAGSVTLVSSSLMANSASIDYKPSLLLQSPIDGCYYVASLSGSTPVLLMSTNAITASFNR